MASPAWKTRLDAFKADVHSEVHSPNIDPELRFVELLNDITNAARGAETKGAVTLPFIWGVDLSERPPPNPFSNSRPSFDVGTAPLSAVSFTKRE